jgi:hypothetical protein
MAVGRITAPYQWFHAAARDVEDHPRLHRELQRAARRPGRTAELTAAEVRVLYVRRPDDPRVNAVMLAVLATEAAERESHNRLRDWLDARRAT